MTKQLTATEVWELARSGFARTSPTGRDMSDAMVSAINQELAPNMARPLPLPRPMSRPPTPPTDQPLQQNSITTFKELVPVRVATGRMLEGNWAGRELDDTRVIGSLFGGPHFILQLGYNQTVGYSASFRVVFVVHMPVPAGASLSDPGLHAEAEQTATGLMLMLNLRRVVAATATALDPHDVRGLHVARAIEDAIPGKPLV